MTRRATTTHAELLEGLGLKHGGRSVLTVVYIWTLAPQADVEAYAHDVAQGGRDLQTYVQAEAPGALCPDQFLKNPPAFGLTVLTNTLEGAGDVDRRFQKAQRDGEIWCPMGTRDIGWAEAAEFWQYAVNRVMQEMASKRFQ